MDGAGPFDAAVPAAPQAAPTVSSPAAGMSPLGRRVLLFVQAFRAARGIGPTYREIMAGCGFASTAPVQHHVDKLVTLGHLVKRNRAARGLDVIRPIERLPSDDPSAPVLSEETRARLLLVVDGYVVELRKRQARGESVGIAPWLDAQRELESFAGWTKS